MYYQDSFWRPEEPLFRAGRRRQRGQVGAVIAGLMLASAAAGAGWYWYHTRTLPPLPPAA